MRHEDTFTGEVYGVPTCHYCNREITENEQGLCMEHRWELEDEIQQLKNEIQDYKGVEDYYNWLIDQYTELTGFDPLVQYHLEKCNAGTEVHNPRETVCTEEA